MVSRVIPTKINQAREFLFRLIISQLFNDGYQHVAVTLSNILHTDPPCPPSDRLMNIVSMGMDKKAEASLTSTGWSSCWGRGWTWSLRQSRVEALLSQPATRQPM